MNKFGIFDGFDDILNQIIVGARRWTDQVNR